VIPADARFAGVHGQPRRDRVAGLPVAAAFFRALDPDDRDRDRSPRRARGSPPSDLMRLSGQRPARCSPPSAARSTPCSTSRHRDDDPAVRRGMAARCILLDTRKTIPACASREYATRMGGAQQPPHGPVDAAMIKDNHVLVAGGVAEAVRRARAAGIEADHLRGRPARQIEPALAAGANHLLLDNMDPRRCASRRARRRPRATEASGGVRLDTIGAIAATGVDYVSVGRLTQSAPAADIGLDFTPL
jgi:nicotinate-nucleotide pyrophosphorylase (carboxylating)